MGVRKWLDATRVIAVAGLLAILVGACSAHSTNTRQPLILSVEPAATDMDQPMTFHVVGLSDNAPATLQVTSTDATGDLWTSRADYVADHQGTIDTTTTTAANGTYTGTAGMGPVASMQPSTGPAAYRWPKGPASFSATVTSADGSATATFTRTLVHPGESIEYSQPTVEANGFSGFYATTAAEKNRRHPAVLLIGGAEGGNDQQVTAAPHRRDRRHHGQVHPALVVLPHPGSREVGGGRQT